MPDRSGGYSGLVPPSPNETEQLKRDRMRRTRLIRLQQVRQQETRIAREQRESLKRRRLQRRHQVAKQAEAEFDRAKKAALEEATEKFRTAMQDIGGAHRSAEVAKTNDEVSLRYRHALQASRNTQAKQLAATATAKVELVRLERDKSEQLARQRRDNQKRAAARAFEGNRKCAEQRDEFLFEAQEAELKAKLAEAKECADRTRIVDATRVAAQHAPQLMDCNDTKIEAVVVKHGTRPCLVDSRPTIGENKVNPVNVLNSADEERDAEVTRAELRSKKVQEQQELAERRAINAIEAMTARNDLDSMEAQLQALMALESKEAGRRTDARQTAMPLSRFVEAEIAAGEKRERMVTKAFEKELLDDRDPDEFDADEKSRVLESKEVLRDPSQSLVSSMRLAIVHEEDSNVTWHDPSTGWTRVERKLHGTSGPDEGGWTAKLTIAKEQSAEKEGVDDETEQPDEISAAQTAGQPPPSSTMRAELFEGAESESIEPFSLSEVARARLDVSGVAADDEREEGSLCSEGYSDLVREFGKEPREATILSMRSRKDLSDSDSIAERGRVRDSLWSLDFTTAIKASDHLQDSSVIASSSTDDEQASLHAAAATSRSERMLGRRVVDSSPKDEPTLTFVEEESKGRNEGLPTPPWIRSRAELGSIEEDSILSEAPSKEDHLAASTAFVKGEASRLRNRVGRQAHGAEGKGEAQGTAKSVDSFPFELGDQRETENADLASEGLEESGFRLQGDAEAAMANPVEPEPANRETETAATARTGPPRILVPESPEMFDLRRDDRDTDVLMQSGLLDRLLGTHTSTGTDSAATIRARHDMSQFPVPVLNPKEPPVLLEDSLELGEDMFDTEGQVKDEEDDAEDRGAKPANESKKKRKKNPTSCKEEGVPDLGDASSDSDDDGKDDDVLGGSARVTSTRKILASSTPELASPQQASPQQQSGADGKNEQGETGDAAAERTMHPTSPVVPGPAEPPRDETRDASFSQSDATWGLLPYSDTKHTRQERRLSSSPRTLGSLSDLTPFSLAAPIYVSDGLPDAENPAAKRSVLQDVDTTSQPGGDEFGGRTELNDAGRTVSLNDIVVCHDTVDESSQGGNIEELLYRQLSLAHKEVSNDGKLSPRTGSFAVSARDSEWTTDDVEMHTRNAGKALKFTPGSPKPSSSVSELSIFSYSLSGSGYDRSAVEDPDMPRCESVVETDDASESESSTASIDPLKWGFSPSTKVMEASPTPEKSHDVQHREGRALEDTHGYSQVRQKAGSDFGQQHWESAISSVDSPERLVTHSSERTFQPGKVGAAYELSSSENGEVAILCIERSSTVKLPTVLPTSPAELQSPEVWQRGLIESTGIGICSSSPKPLMTSLNSDSQADPLKEEMPSLATSTSVEANRVIVPEKKQQQVGISEAETWAEGPSLNSTVSDGWMERSPVVRSSRRLQKQNIKESAVQDDSRLSSVSENQLPDGCPDRVMSHEDIRGYELVDSASDIGADVDGTSLVRASFRESSTLTVYSLSTSSGSAILGETEGSEPHHSFAFRTVRQGSALGITGDDNSSLTSSTGFAVQKTAPNMSHLVKELSDFCRDTDDFLSEQLDASQDRSRDPVVGDDGNLQVVTLGDRSNPESSPSFSSGLLSGSSLLMPKAVVSAGATRPPGLTNAESVEKDLRRSVDSLVRGEPTGVAQAACDSPTLDRSGVTAAMSSPVLQSPLEASTMKRVELPGRELSSDPSAMASPGLRSPLEASTMKRVVLPGRELSADPSAFRSFVTATSARSAVNTSVHHREMRELSEAKDESRGYAGEGSISLGPLVNVQRSGSLTVYSLSETSLATESLLGDLAGSGISRDDGPLRCGAAQTQRGSRVGSSSSAKGASQSELLAELDELRRETDELLGREEDFVIESLRSDYDSSLTDVRARDTGIALKASAELQSKAKALSPPQIAEVEPIVEVKHAKWKDVAFRVPALSSVDSSGCSVPSLSSIPSMAASSVASRQQLLREIAPSVVHTFSSAPPKVLADSTGTGDVPGLEHGDLSIHSLAQSASLSEVQVDEMSSLRDLSLPGDNARRDESYQASLELQTSALTAEDSSPPSGSLNVRSIAEDSLSRSRLSSSGRLPLHSLSTNISEKLSDSSQLSPEEVRFLKAKSRLRREHHDRRSAQAQRLQLLREVRKVEELRSQAIMRTRRRPRQSSSRLGI